MSLYTQLRSALHCLPCWSLIHLSTKIDLQISSILVVIQAIQKVFENSEKSVSSFTIDQARPHHLITFASNHSKNILRPSNSQALSKSQDSTPMTRLSCQSKEILSFGLHSQSHNISASIETMHHISPQNPLISGSLLKHDPRTHCLTSLYFFASSTNQLFNTQ
jgi:hypothetical protein